MTDNRQQKRQNLVEVIKVLQNNMLDDIYTNEEKNFFKEEIIRCLGVLASL